MSGVFTVTNPKTSPLNYTSVFAAVASALSIWTENGMETLVVSPTPTGQERVLVRFAGSGSFREASAK